MKFSIAAVLPLAAFVAAQGHTPRFGTLVACRIGPKETAVWVTDQALCRGAGADPVAGQCCLRSDAQYSSYKNLCGQRGDSAGTRGEVETIAAETSC
ncbi:hypothetical protein C8034_v004831 [Colletotrichum sidae]|uniref:Uncharacterized protein n=2 Tax=Colletotrichum orbiculare species complex TaxID=2707354 RepID=N4VNF3_COLOR|nr:hypothetical protein Cob_v005563 [Colletotrichum orbiculare MAFF 240422]TEA13281.1 hypothetical protein C8034_v004831 [Colletotrichum sidae]